MSVGYILSLMALRDHIVIVDFMHDSIYDGVVEDVPHDIRDMVVASIEPAHYYGYYDYLWIEVL